MSKHDKGKWAESEAQKWLDARSAADIRFAYHRYPDAHAARGALQPQPADYLVARALGTGCEACHLEVKETKEVNRLSKSKVGQYGKLKLFDEAGFRTIVLIYRSTLNDWTYLRRRELFHFDECPPSFSFADRPTFPTAAAALQEIFK